MVSWACRSLDKKVLLELAWTKGQSWLKDQVKPTSIIEEDDYLPRVSLHACVFDAFRCCPMFLAWTDFFLLS